MTPRQSDILRGVVESHIETSEPVGSKYIARRYSLPLSPATIRHEMGMLEDLGYLSHPHTSSGRVPTDGGYRYYLDHASFEEALPEPEFSRIAGEITRRCRELRAMEAFLDNISGWLSSVTREVGLSLAASVERDFSEKLDELRLSLQGLTHILEKPEFHDIHKLKAILRTLEEKIILKQWLLKKAQETKVSVSIGHEHGYEALEDCAIVTARYSAGELGDGVIAVLGPKRMPYRQVIPLVSRAADVISALFEAGEFQRS